MPSCYAGTIPRDRKAQHEQAQTDAANRQVQWLSDFNAGARPLPDGQRGPAYQGGWHLRDDAQRRKVGAERQKNRSALMLAPLLDMPYLTGQRISDLLSLAWSAFGRDGTRLHA